MKGAKYRMGLEGVRDKKLLYHLTKLDNMEIHPYSAFDVAVKNTYSTDEFVYICIRRALAEFNNFKILIKHPL